MLVYELVSCSVLGRMFAFVRLFLLVFDLGEFFLFFGVGSMRLVGVVEVFGETVELLV